MIDSLTLSRRVSGSARTRRSMAVMAAVIAFMLSATAMASFADVPKQIMSTLTVDVREGRQGTEVDVPVFIATSGGQIGALSFFIDYDSSLLELIGWELDPRLMAAGKLLGHEIHTDSVSFVIASPGPAPGKANLDTPITDGVLMVLTFFVADDAVAQTVPLTVHAFDAADIAANEVPTAFEDGAVLIGCTPPPAVTPSASQGRSDGVLVSWTAVAGAAEYRVYRSLTNTPTAAVAVGEWQTALGFLDTTADPIVEVPGMGCSGPQAVVTRYYYWVLARSETGCVGDFGSSAQGSRGAAKHFETALPAPKGIEASSAIAPDAAVAVRLRADEDIDPASVWGIALEDGVETGTAYWQPVDLAAANDGWLVASPDKTWTPGATICVRAGARTVSGVELSPVTAEFSVALEAKAVDGALWQPWFPTYEYRGFEAGGSRVREAALYYAESVRACPGAVGEAYAIAPAAPYGTPQRIWLPVPNGENPEDLDVLYLAGGKSGAVEWVAGDDVAGWLVPDSRTVVTLDGVTYCGILVRHGATLRLARRGGAVSAAIGSLPAMERGPGMWADALPMALAFLLLLARSKNRARIA